MAFVVGKRFEDLFEEALEVEGFAEYLTDSGGGCPFFDSRVEVSGSHENYQFRLEAPGVLGQFESIHPRHVLVGEKDTVGPFCKQAEGILASFGACNVYPLAFHGQFHEYEDIAVIVNDEDAFCWPDSGGPVPLSRVHGDSLWSYG